MSRGNSIPPDETGFDQLLAFSLPLRNARGRVVRLGPVLNTILAAHHYPPAIQSILAEALTLTALFGGLMKDQDSQLTLQAHGDTGVIDLLVCDYRNGELRGYVRHDKEKIVGIGANPALSLLFGKAYLVITFDLAATDQRYQGIVPLEGSSLAEACELYFAQSEQVPSLIRVAVNLDGAQSVAGGLLVQHLAEGEEGRERLHVRMEHPEWEHVAALTGSIRHHELVDPALSLEGLIWRLFHEESELRATPGAIVTQGCRCSIEHYRSVLLRFPPEDRESMRDSDGTIPVDCAFCSKIFRIDT